MYTIITHITEPYTSAVSKQNVRESGNPYKKKNGVIVQAEKAKKEENVEKSGGLPRWNKVFRIGSFYVD